MHVSSMHISPRQRAYQCYNLGLGKFGGKLNSPREVLRALRGLGGPSGLSKDQSAQNDQGPERPDRYERAKNSGGI
jgi:hypothetical protein